MPIAVNERRGWPFVNATAEHACWLARRRHWPRISIVTPSYNQGQYLEQTIQSVLRQDYPDLEYIVMDGGSTDGSADIISRYAPWLRHWESAPDQGQSDAINKGFARSTGEILGWLNSDDFLAPAALFKVADALSDAPHVGAVVGIGHKIDSRGRSIYAPLPDEVTLESLFGWCNGNNFMQPACFFTREAWESAGPLRVDLDYCMDLALWFKIAEHLEFKVLRETLAFINTHFEAKTIKHRPQMFAETALLIASQPSGLPHGKQLLFDTLQRSYRRKIPVRRVLDRVRALVRSRL